MSALFKEALAAVTAIDDYFPHADFLGPPRAELAVIRSALETAQREAKAPPVYPELFNGQRVMQPTPSILVEIAPSGYAERIAYGGVRYDAARLVKYVLAPPELAK